MIYSPYFTGERNRTLEEWGILLVFARLGVKIQGLGCLTPKLYCYKVIPLLSRVKVLCKNKGREGLVG
jgi:hypothetical protein